MTLTQGERSLVKHAFGTEAVHGDGTTPTALVPAISGSIIDLDRSPATVNEDYGTLAMNQAGRGYFGVRLAKFPWKGDCAFETIMHHLGAAIAGGVVPTTPYAGVKRWRYVMDLTSDTLDSKCIQETDNIQAYQMVYALVESLKLSFATLVAPGNAPWQCEADYIGRDKAPCTFASSPTVPSTVETVMGHLTRAYLGNTSTAFAALAEEVGLLAFDLTIPTGVVPRKQGGATDTFDVHGRTKVDPQGTITFYESAGTLADVYQGWQGGASPSPVMLEQRLRVKALGGVLVAAANSIQTITFSATNATSGDFTLTHGGNTTAPALAYNANAAAVQAALEALASIGTGNVTVTGSVAAGFVATFGGAKAGLAMTAITGNGAGLVGASSPYTISVAQTSIGGVAYNKYFQIDTRMRLRAVPIAEDGNGATVYQGQMSLVADDTLGGILAIEVQNGVATLP